MTSEEIFTIMARAAIRISMQDCSCKDVNGSCGYCLGSQDLCKACNGDRRCKNCNGTMTIQPAPFDLSVFRILVGGSILAMDAWLHNEEFARFDEFWNILARWVFQVEKAGIEHAQATGIDVKENIKIANDALQRGVNSLENSTLIISGSQLTPEELIELGID